MKKNDILILVALFGLWLAWPLLDRHVIKKYFFHTPPPSAEQPAEPAVVSTPSAAPELKLPEKASDVAPVEPEVAPEVAAAIAEQPEARKILLENERIRLTLSSHGAAVLSAELKDYPLTAEKGSSPVVLDFSTRPALAYEALPGLDDRWDFRETVESANQVTLERETPAGAILRRTYSLDDGYQVTVTDTFVSQKTEPVLLPSHSVRLGPMFNLPGEEAARGVVNQGVDSLSPGGEKVRNWGGKIAGWFATTQKEKGLPKLPVRLEWPLEAALEWVSVKNKYFVQILDPDGGADRGLVVARRRVSDEEAANPAFKPKGASVEEVSAVLYFGELALPPHEPVTRTLTYYVGPKKYTELNRYGKHKVDVMEFGMWAPIGKLLLSIMNAIFRVIPSYGVAIMLLTILIRVVFWPVTHKSTESMKKMQAIQPLINEVRQKYKDNAQKQQQEIMALYKAHKVNPVGGCLPMIIQIPVFIALFVVLRSAIELRFAPFLWIRDLSRPENLLAGLLPFGLSLNILPLVMAATMAWQQKLTPSGGDPNQQKMMMFMPVMMLVLFYNFAAGLVLYWTTNQCLMIAQQVLMQRKKKAAVA